MRPPEPVPEKGRAPRPASGGPIEEFFRPRLEVEPGILMGFVARNRRDALYEVEDALRLAAFLSEYRFDDLGRLRLAEPTFAQEFGPVVVGARNDALARGLDAVDERHRRGVGEASKRRRRFMGEP